MNNEYNKLNIKRYVILLFIITNSEIFYYLLEIYEIMYKVSRYVDIMILWNMEHNDEFRIQYIVFLYCIHIILYISRNAECMIVCNHLSYFFLKIFFII